MQQTPSCHSRDTWPPRVTLTPCVVSHTDVSVGNADLWCWRILATPYPRCSPSWRGMCTSRCGPRPTLHTPLTPFECTNTRSGCMAVWLTAPEPCAPHPSQLNRLESPGEASTITASWSERKRALAVRCMDSEGAKELYIPAATLRARCRPSLPLVCRPWGEPSASSWAGVCVCLALGYGTVQVSLRPVCGRVDGQHHTCVDQLPPGRVPGVCGAQRYPCRVFVCCGWGLTCEGACAAARPGCVRVCVRWTTLGVAVHPLGPPRLRSPARQATMQWRWCGATATRAPSFRCKL